MKKFISLIFLSLTPGVAFGAFAEPDIPETPADTLPDVEVVSARASKETTSTTPFHRIDDKKIRETGITDISDALRRLPGINLRDYGGAGGLKTVSVRGLGAQHTGVIYDGIPLSDMRSGEIDLARYSLDNMGSISLTAGDNDDIFMPARNAASAATVTISTIRTPDLLNDGFGGSVQMRVASFGNYNPFLYLTYANGRNFAIGATGEFTHAKNDYPFLLRNGQYVTHEKRSNSEMNSGHGEINATWWPTPTSSLNAKVYYYDNNRRLPGPVVYYLEESNERLHDRNFFAQTQYRNKLSSLFSLAAYAKFNWSGSHYTDVNGRYPGGMINQNFLQREVYASGALLFTPMAGLSFDYSIDWFYNNLNSNLPTDQHPYRNSILQSITAKYKVWRLTAMARALYSVYLNRARGGVKVNDAIRLSPSVSISIQPIESESFYVRASYKNIFRVPTFNELYFDNYGSLNLKPEVTDQLNAGVTWESQSSGFLRSINVTADGYINFVSNKIVAIPYNLFKWTMSNMGKARIFGLDVTLDTELALTRQHSLLAVANYSYQRAQPRTDRAAADWMKQIAYTPLNSGAGSLSWLNPWVNVAAKVTYCSSRYTTNTNLAGTKISGYAELGFSIFRTFDFGKRKLELCADLNNVLNKQYEIVARYPMPGRSWGISAKFAF